MSIRAEVVFLLQCDHRVGSMKCDARLVAEHASAEYFARRIAARGRWASVRGKDYCPAHAPRPKP